MVGEVWRVGEGAIEERYASDVMNGYRAVKRLSSELRQRSDEEIKGREKERTGSQRAHTRPILSGGQYHRVSESSSGSKPKWSGTVNHRS